MQDEERVVVTRIHQSLTRPDLVIGCERMPIIFLIATAFIFGFLLQKPITIAFSVLLIAVGIPVLRWAARRDPNMYRVWSRHFAYQNQYLCNPSVGRVPPPIIEQQRS
jgi:type IV secretory pathway TrbD component